ncbi:hypothetical protein QTI51_37715 [Variovorax sp. J22G73]|uniref:hypothetical protein n=1 Tax=unclassified Variovorax TaxID=663243 RepID=UPI0025790E00|nr:MULTISPECIES: hypothetical protein [unclassified Variovorax]MDM0010608.1 hypothetical protein [Variovorax sp. J22R203]MDM0103064.1 hypothetical protein [Variovorax sp. J22G73]
MPARIGRRSLELAVYVLPDKLAAMVFLGPMSLMVRTASDWPNCKHCPGSPIARGRVSSAA